MAQPIKPATQADSRLEIAKRKFVETLRTIFQFDAADLDFGIYRVLNMRREALDEFLTDDLMPQVETLLEGNESLTRTALEAEKQEIEEKAFALGVRDFATLPKWLELKAKLDATPETSTLAREVFSDLTTFFSRYYDEGDFMALPRYKADTYAIPYDGSEVKLHWANADQYYVKSTEVFGNYRVKLEGLPGEGARYLNLKLAAAETDRDNNKASEKRRFVLRTEKPYTLDGDTLTVWLEWKAVTKDSGKGAPKQEELNAEAAEAILEDKALDKNWRLVLARKAGQDAKRPVAEQRGTLEFQLYRYTRKQSSDYFIHKDLGGFLRRELDFFIKNEVLLLDDIESMGEADFAVPLRKVRALRVVALKIIDWLAQVEDFQKRLFLKKRFVVRMRLAIYGHEPSPSVSEESRQEARGSANLSVFGTKEPVLKGLQLEIGAATPSGLPSAYLTPDSRKPTPWLEGLNDVDSQVTGLLVHSENFGALRLLANGRREAIDTIYIDPPYNTGQDGFLYRDAYQHSSWLSMIHDRISLGRRFLCDEGAMFVSIDEAERDRLGTICASIFGEVRYRASFVWQRRDTPANDSTGISMTHEYLLLLPKSDSFKRGLLPRTEEQLSIYRNPDNDPRGRWTRTSLVVKNFVRGNDYPYANPAGREVRPPAGMGWAWTQERMDEAQQDGRIWWGQTGDGMPYQKRFLSEANDGVVPISWWDYEFASTNRNARAELRSMFPGEAPFDTPKPVRLLERVLQVAQASTVLDFFAGSGTTGHACIGRIRQGAADTKFVLIESGDHFDTVLVPRILKATYASEWKDGKPVKVDPIKALYKIIELESYDDTLENLELKPPDTATQSLLDRNAQAREDYVLRYMLDLESQGSLLDLQRFEKPWNYTIKVRRGGLVETSPIDLVETFNYLLGLHVKSYDTFEQQDLLFVQGVIRAPEGATNGDKKILVVWRDCERWPQAKLDKVMRRFFGRVSDADKKLPLDDFHAVYVNGDHHLDNLVTDGLARILPIEETFHRLMFDTSEEA